MASRNPTDKTCETCGNSASADRVVYCTQCKRNFQHWHCMWEHQSAAPPTWRCGKCLKESNGTKEHDLTGTSSSQGLTKEGKSPTYPTDRSSMQRISFAGSRKSKHNSTQFIPMEVAVEADKRKEPYVSRETAIRRPQNEVRDASPIKKQPLTTECVLPSTREKTSDAQVHSLTQGGSASHWVKENPSMASLGKRKAPDEPATATPKVPPTGTTATSSRKGDSSKKKAASASGDTGHKSR